MQASTRLDDICEAARKESLLGPLIFRPERRTRFIIFCIPEQLRQHTERASQATSAQVFNNSEFDESGTLAEGRAASEPRGLRRASDVARGGYAKPSPKKTYEFQPRTRAGAHPLRRAASSFMRNPRTSLRGGRPIGRKGSRCNLLHFTLCPGKKTKTLHIVCLTAQIHWKRAHAHALISLLRSGYSLLSPAGDASLWS